MRLIGIFACWAVMFAAVAQDPLKRDSIPLPGKTKPVIIGTPPMPPTVPAQVDTFQPSNVHPEPLAPLRPDSLQRDDRDPDSQRGITDTIPKRHW